jgi:2-oxoglutarate ferredoxin oxidoreductase subunit alpha
MQEAVMHARGRGEHVSQLVVHSLFPVPQNAFRRAFANHSRIIVPELNHGQYVLEIERIAYALDPRPRVVSLPRVDGEMITPQQILNALA